jgi:hypothetical protein
MITRPGFPQTYQVYTTVKGGFPPGWETTVPPGMLMGRSGKASWDPQAGPQYPIVRFAPVGFTLGRPKLMMDPSDPSTWQRPYVFTP